jgi:phosphoenolpyruvate-protein kinase (PTS system EI component)
VSGSQVIRGSAVSSGVARGKAYVLASAERAVILRRIVEEGAVEGELARFEAALATAERDLLALKNDVANRIGVDEADMFAAQALVVRDHALHGQVVALVRHDRINVEAAVADVIDKFTRTFDQIPDAYLRERAADIRDVGRRVLAALIDEVGAKGLDVPEGSILVAEELSPSTTAELELGRVRAFVTARGGKFTHTAILARSIGMPAVTGVSNAALVIKTGDPLIVDGVSGVVFVNPDGEIEREYDRLINVQPVTPAGWEEWWEGFRVDRARSVSISRRWQSGGVIRAAGRSRWRTSRSVAGHRGDQRDLPATAAAGALHSRSPPGLTKSRLSSAGTVSATLAWAATRLPMAST